MTAERSKRVSLGIGYFLWILFYVHLQIHKAQSTTHHHNVIFMNDESNDIAENVADVESSNKKSDFYKIKNNDSKLQSIKTHNIKPRKSRDVNRSYRPYNDFPILEPILLTNYIQRNPFNNLFNVGAIVNPSTKFNINPTNTENNHPATQDTGVQMSISSTKESSLSRIVAKSMDEDSTITVNDHEIPMNVRPNAFFLNDDDFVMYGNTTLQPLAVPYTNTDDTLDRQTFKSSIASDIIISTIIPTAELQLLPTSSLLISSNLNDIVSSSFDSSSITISKSDIHPSETELYSFSTVVLDTTSDLIDPLLISSQSSPEIKVEASNVISESTISSSWNSFTSEIENVDSKYSTLSTSLDHSDHIVVSYTATFSNETDSTTPYVMSREPNDPEPDIITAPPFGSEVKTINVSTEFGLGNKFSHKGQVLEAEIDSNPENTNKSKLNNSKPSHPSSYRPFEDTMAKSPPQTTIPPPAKHWDNSPSSFSDPVGDDYSIETKNDGPILETCTIGDDSSCDAKLNEVCRKDEGVSNCGCRLGSIRKKNNDICRRGREFSALFAVAKDGNAQLNYGQDFLPDGRLFSRTKNQLEKAITNIFRGSEFRSYIISTKVNSFVPINDRLVANTTIVFDSGSIFDLTDLMSRLKRALTSSFSNNNNRIGKSSFYTREDAEVTVEDIDECKHSGLNDCDQFAICENTIGSFSCECKKGYKDPDAGSPDNKGRKCGGACSNDYCNSHGECHLVDVNVQSCKCHGSWSGEKCSVDSQVLGIAIGSSVVAFLIIIATLIFLLRWSRRSTQKATQKATTTRTLSASTPSNTFTYMKTPQYHMVGPPMERPPERPPPPLVTLSSDNNYSREQPRWPEDPFEPFRAEQRSIYHNVEDNTQEDMGHYRAPKTAILSPYKANVFPVTEEDLSQYFGSKYNLTEAAHKQQ